MPRVEAGDVTCIRVYGDGLAADVGRDRRTPSRPGEYTTGATVATPSQELGRPSAMSAWVGSSPKEVTRGIGSTSPNSDGDGLQRCIFRQSPVIVPAPMAGRAPLAFEIRTLRRALPAQHNAGHGRAPSPAGGHVDLTLGIVRRVHGQRLQFVLLAEVLGCAALGCTTTATPEPEVSSQQASSRPPTSSGGGLIAFVSDREGVDALYLMRADGTDVRRLTEQLPPASHPAWSADGRRLAFNAGSTRTSDIYLISVDGSGLTQVTRDAGANFYELVT